MLGAGFLPDGRKPCGKLVLMVEDSCQAYVSDCHVRAAAELISHTWDPVVLSALRLGPTRRRELLTRIAGVSDKALAESLRRLSSSNMIMRAPDGEPAWQRGSAVYQLSAKGESFAHGPLAQLAQWAADNQDDPADLPSSDARA